MSLSLENIINRQMFIKNLIKQHTCIRVSCSIMIFFNEMDMSDYKSKHQRYLKIKKKKLKGKMKHSQFEALVHFSPDI